jgi:DUF971 family protein
LQYVKPKIVKRIDPRRTDIIWNDGHISPYPSWYLRENCHCAECVEEFTGKHKVAPGSIPSSLERINLQPVGNYALNFSWSDGHNAGIYSFEFLRSICPCSECLPGGLKEPPEHVLKPGAFEV